MQNEYLIDDLRRSVPAGQNIWGRLSAWNHQCMVQDVTCVIFLSRLSRGWLFKDWQGISFHITSCSCSVVRKALCLTCTMEFVDKICPRAPDAFYAIVRGAISVEGLFCLDSTPAVTMILNAEEWKSPFFGLSCTSCNGVAYVAPVTISDHFRERPRIHERVSEAADGFDMARQTCMCVPIRNKYLKVLSWVYLDVYQIVYTEYRHYAKTEMYTTDKMGAGSRIWWLVLPARGNEENFLLWHRTLLAKEFVCVEAAERIRKRYEYGAESIVE